MMTITEEISFSMYAGRLKRRATVYTRRKMNAPTTAPTALFRIEPFPMNALPISREARAMVTMPLPMVTFTDFWLWARRHPDRAVKEEDMQRPTMVVKAGLMDEDFTMSGLSPVALMERPSLVLRKKLRKATTRATKNIATTRR